MPAFAACNRWQLHRIARWGDVVEAQPGEVLAREDHADHWFYVVLSGSVRVSRTGRPVATLGPNAHFGELAIVGFAPQAATAVVTAPSVLFVLGPRYLLSLGHVPSVQRGLFPGVAPSEYKAFARRLFDQGSADWHRLAPHYVPDPVNRRRTRPPGRPLSWAEAIRLLAGETTPRHPASVTISPFRERRDPHRTRWKWVAAAAALVGLASGALLYHPPVAVLVSGPAVDVVDDIVVSGAPVDRPTGQYLMTWVDVERPNALGALVAFARRRPMRSTRAVDPGGVDRRTAARMGHDAFEESRRHAVAAAEKVMGLESGTLKVEFRARAVSGPSAGLVYALALVDLLDGADLADGRVIAATGEIGEAGEVVPVGYVGVKSAAFRSGRAVLILVPAGQAGQVRARADVRAVSTLEDALRILRAG